MTIPENIINQVQDRTDIVEVISRYVQLKKTGRNYKSPCPFHHEKTPSFVVSPDKQIYHCFGCGAGGNVFSFLMKHENMEFPEVIEMLAEKAGITLPRSQGQSKELSTLSNQLYKINEVAMQFFQAHLAKNKSVLEYLNSRGIGEEGVKSFRLGYAPDSWEELYNFLKQKKIDASLIERSGLVVSNDKGGYYDRFRRRVIFPIIDLKEKVLGFGGRVLDASLPKYINSPETPIYIKGRNLYGLHLSKESIKKAGYALIVEGYLDFLVPYQAGVKNLIATLGTALTVDQVKLIKRFANTVIMLYDPDEAGEAASLRNMDIFISEDVNVYIGELPQGMDPDSCIRKLGAEEFQKIIKSSKNLFDYKLGKLYGKFDPKTANGKTSIAREFLPTISKINNAVLKDSMIKKLAEKLSVGEDALKTELKKVKPDYLERHQVETVLQDKGKKANGAEEMILAVMLEGGNLVTKVKEAISVDEFDNATIREFVKVILDMHAQGLEITPAKLISHVNNREEASRLIAEAANLTDIIEDREHVLFDCISWIKKRNMDLRLERLTAEIKAAHDSHDESKCRSLMIEHEKLRKSNYKVLKS